MTPKRIVVVIARAERAPEALRAAVGLTLRGDRVDLCPRVPLDRADPWVARALAALATLGGDAAAPLSAVREADCVEVWS